MKILWEKEKMLVASIFSFSHNVFYHITDKNHCFSDIRFVFRKCLEFGNVQNFLFWQGVKGLVRLANGFVAERKRTKHVEFGYPVTKFISSDARDSSDRFVERISQIMTVHQTGVSVRFIRWKVLNILKT